MIEIKIIDGHLRLFRCDYDEKKHGLFIVKSNFIQKLCQSIMPLNDTSIVDSKNNFHNMSLVRAIELYNRFLEFSEFCKALIIYSLIMINNLKY